MRSPIVLVILLGFIGSFSVQASLKMKAMGFWNRNHHTPKPWDADTRSRSPSHQTEDYQQQQHHFGQTHLVQLPQEDSAINSDDVTEAPCVGMCYYKKIMGLEEKENEEKLQNEVIENEPLKERKPCVGLCHYYRSLGIENPYEKRPVKRFPVPK